MKTRLARVHHDMFLGANVAKLIRDRGEQAEWIKEPLILDVILCENDAVKYEQESVDVREHLLYTVQYSFQHFLEWKYHFEESEKKAIWRGRYQ